MIETLGDYLRKLRGGQPIRIVCAALDADQSSWSKYERGERFPTESMLPAIAAYFMIEVNELRIRYLSDKIVYKIIQEENPEELLQVAEEKLKYIKSKNIRQGKINFNGIQS